MIKTKLAKAVSLAVAGVAMSAGASSAMASTTMYNTWDVGQAPGTYSSSAQTTDGWLYSDGKQNGATGGTLNAWAGGAGSVPFGYTGKTALNWAVQLTSATDSGVISRQDAIDRYGVAADIDTGKGAWVDAQLNAQNNPAPTGWRHAVDVGLIQTAVDTDIRLSASVLANTVGFDSNFGISVYDGMTNVQSWGHHGSWHGGYILGDQSVTNLARINGNDPIGMTGLTFVGFSDGSNLTLNANNQDYLIFHALAGHTYTVILGGSDGGQTWSGNQASYALNVQAVPVPGAVWLFGSAVAGLVGFGRRKAAVAA
ncbi:hypothetical protein [Methylomonas sp. LL1]|uniref:hypothetical protein n=1 Tax=Methylomonas sp. LL1 TaxID=2785785 RepID=UPI001E39D557|nr:hypothetical protein [Methylomonas sp. LL1]